MLSIAPAQQLLLQKHEALYVHSIFTYLLTDRAYALGSEGGSTFHR